MPIRQGNGAIARGYVGSSLIQRAYLGNNLVYGTAPSTALDPPTTGLHLWYRSDTGITTSGSIVTAWASRLVNTAIALTPVAGNGATYNASGGANNTPFLAFDRVNDNLIGSFTATPNRAIAIVFRLTSTPQANDTLVSTSLIQVYWTSSNGIGVVCRNSTGGFEDPGQIVFNGINQPPSAWPSVPGASVPLNVWHWLIVRRASTSNTSGIGIGSETNGITLLAPVDIAEVLHWNQDIGTAGVTAFDNYMADRYGL